ncbi:MAG: hypothetical protein GY953_09530, partial [bacterium]|nr:hypothetical protein [bacterium]
MLDVATRSLYRWTGDSLARMEWSGEGFAGEPIAIAQPRAGLLATVERRGDSLWMARRSLRDGLVRFEAMLPGVSAPVFLGADGALVYRSLEGLTVRGPDGSERCLPLPVAVAGFEQMGEGWIRVLTVGSAHYALRITATEARIHRLPGGRQ